jgi:hypothetical protein
MKITAISCIGTYPTHINYTVASLYHLVDEVVIINGGYDVKDINKGDCIPLERDTKLLKAIDIDNKVRIFTPSWEAAKLAKKGKEEAGRGRNLSLAVQTAYRLKADWVLKTDADILFDHTVTKNMLLELIENSDSGRKGYRFGMWELYGDYEHYQGLPTWAPEDDTRFPSSNDAPQFYKPSDQDWYVGGGAPVVKAHIMPYQKVNCFHVRNCPPIDCNPYEYFYNRFWYHTIIPPYTDGKRIDFEKMEEIVGRKAKDLLSVSVNPGTSSNKVGDGNDPRIPPYSPHVVLMGCKKYIASKKVKPEGKVQK